MTANTGDYPYEDIVYLRHSEAGLLARIFRPEGEGPFPAIIELHGGAWSKFDRTRGKTVHEALARAGVFVMALDFRHGPDGAYPKSLEDINFAIRWLKANAAGFRVDPARVGLSGNSTGGHLAMLAAMRPDDPRYATLPLPGGEALDASVRCVVMLWPVINPLGRYRFAKRCEAAGDPAGWVSMIIASHDAYWQTEARMAEANPLMALERGEAVELPPTMWVQASDDAVHNYRDEASGSGLPEADRFAALYRSAGGHIDLEYFEAPMMFTTVHPTMPASLAALDRIVAFVSRWTA